MTNVNFIEKTPTQRVRSEAVEKALQRRHKRQTHQNKFSTLGAQTSEHDSLPHRSMRRKNERSERNAISDRHNSNKFFSRNFSLIVLSVICCVLGLVLWLSGQSAESSYVYSHEQEINKDLQNTYNELKKQTSEEQSPLKIAQKAKEIGMVFPDEVSVYVQTSTGWKKRGQSRVTPPPSIKNTPGVVMEPMKKKPTKKNKPFEGKISGNNDDRLQHATPLGDTAETLNPLPKPINTMQDSESVKDSQQDTDHKAQPWIAPTQNP